MTTGMMTGLPLLGVAKALAALWHVVAFGTGLVLVVYSFQALLGTRRYERAWAQSLWHADIHLWLSGLAIIALGIASTGAEKYLSNPKLWTKVLVVVVWTLATLLMRQRAAAWFASAKRAPILALSGVSFACWIYGAFLGCARDLAYGAVPFAALAGGFAAVLAASVLIAFTLDEHARFGGTSRGLASPSHAE
jgi:uncharacterized membrane protein